MRLLQRAPTPVTLVPRPKLWGPFGRSTSGLLLRGGGEGAVVLNCEREHYDWKCTVKHVPRKWGTFVGVPPRPRCSSVSPHTKQHLMQGSGFFCAIPRNAARGVRKPSDVCQFMYPHPPWPDMVTPGLSCMWCWRHCQHKQHT